MADKRPSSSGYRFPRVARPRTSEFHQNCIPAAIRKQAAEQPAAAAGSSEKTGQINQVNEDKVWKQSVNTEITATRQWKQNWGFLAEFDSRGEVKEEKELPDRANMFSDNVPNTVNGEVGRGLQTDIGQNIQRMQLQFDEQHRKRRLDAEMVCY